MILARVEGTAVSTHKHPSLKGQKMLICQPVDEKGVAYGVPWIAIDPWGAGLHSTVIVSTDGAATRNQVKDEYSPVRNMVVGIVDEGDSCSSSERGSL